MKKLVLLQGIPGSGKSTFIKQSKNLEPYTLSPDVYRMQLAGLSMTEDGLMRIDQSVSNLAFKRMLEDLEYRMKNGVFTIIDATHTHSKSFKNYRGLAEKYGYDVYLLPFDVDLDTAIERNSNRAFYKQVSNEVIEKMYDNLKAFNEDTRSLEEKTGIKNIKYIEKIEDIYVKPTDVSKYDEIKVIGDVHGCYDVLQEALGELNDNTLYIFTGDMLDRGIQNKEVLNFCFEHMHDENVIFIEGNHDTHLKNYVNKTFPTGKKGNAIVPQQFKQFTLPQLLDGLNDTEKQEFFLKLKEFCSVLKDCMFISYSVEGAKTQYFFITHGGVTFPYQPIYISSIQMIKGVGPHEFDVDSAYSKTTCDFYTKRTGYDYEMPVQTIKVVTQVHGHRMSTNIDSVVDNEFLPSGSVCLEGSVETGGKLVVYTIHKDECDYEICGKLHHSHYVWRGLNTYENKVFDTDKILYFGTR